MSRTLATVADLTGTFSKKVPVADGQAALIMAQAKHWCVTYSPSRNGDSWTAFSPNGDASFYVPSSTVNAHVAKRWFRTIGTYSWSDDKAADQMGVVRVHDAGLIPKARAFREAYADEIAEWEAVVTKPTPEPAPAPEPEPEEHLKPWMAHAYPTLKGGRFYPSAVVNEVWVGDEFTGRYRCAQCDWEADKPKSVVAHHGGQVRAGRHERVSEYAPPVDGEGYTDPNGVRHDHRAPGTVTAEVDVAWRAEPPTLPEPEPEPPALPIPLPRQPDLWEALKVVTQAIREAVDAQASYADMEMRAERAEEALRLVSEERDALRERAELAEGNIAALRELLS